MNLNLSTGDEIIFDGQGYRLVRRLAGGRLQFEHTANSEPLVITDTELVDRWNERRVRFKLRVRPDKLGAEVADRTEKMKRDFELLDPKKQNRARRRLAFVEGVLAREPHAITKVVVGPIIQEIAKARGEDAPSASSVCRWIAYWRRAQRDIRVLVEASHLRGNRKPRLAPEVAEAIDYYVSTEYMNPNRKSPKDVWAFVVTYIEKLNVARSLDSRLQLPSIKSIYKAIGKLDKRDVVCARNGAKAAKNAFDPVGRGPIYTKPLERVEIDHTPIDAIVVDKSDGLPLGRPTATFLLDAYSRLPVGWHVGFDPPGCVAAAHALRHAILPKTYVKTLYDDINVDYPVWGKPYQLVSDIGPEFISDWFTDSCEQLGVHLQYCPPGDPQMKGRIERFNGTFQRDCIHKLPGTTFSNILERADTKSEKLAVVTLQDLNKIIHSWIITLYARAPHRGIKDVPMRLWEEGVLRYPLILPPEVGDLDMLLSRPEKRTLQRTGIEVMGLRYNDDQVATFLRRLGPGVSVPIRIDPNDLSHIYVQDSLTEKFVKVPSIEPEYTRGLTLAQHKVIQEYCRKKIDGYIQVSQLCEARVKLQEFVAKLFRSKKGGRPNRGARFLGIGEPEIVRNAQGVHANQSHIVSKGPTPFPVENEAHPSPQISSDAPFVGSESVPSDSSLHLASTAPINPTQYSDHAEEPLDLDAEIAARKWNGDLCNE